MRNIRHKFLFFILFALGTVFLFYHLAKAQNPPGNLNEFLQNGQAETINPYYIQEQSERPTQNVLEMGGIALLALGAIFISDFPFRKPKAFWKKIKFKI